ncbi:MAG: TRAP transporter large permease subunit [Chloroflexi bacterium]|nr:TRAP transporter large permease subunit [Chloroflexota bacterium]
MSNFSPELATILMMGGILVGLLTGFPVAFIFGTVGIGVGVLFFGTGIGEVIYSRMYGMMIEYVLLALPLFVFMGVMLETSGITERLYEALYLWLGGLRGGLAIVTILIGTILAACVGIIAASITMLALVGLPAMMKRGYDKSLATGAICAGGVLGILIPPSIMLVIYGPTAGVSVGKLFMGAFIPGFILSTLYMSYVAIRCYFQPHLGPSIPAEERKVPLATKLGKLAQAVLPPVILIFSVLGVIYLGIAPPTDAAGMGALAATLLAVVYRRFTWRGLVYVAYQTMKTSGFIYLIITMAVAFTSVFIAAGAGDVMKNLILSTPGGKWGAFIVVHFIFFILGMFVEWIGIIYIMVPIVTPVGQALGFDPVWFAVMLCVNLQMAFMTPPVASAIFILRGACPREYDIRMVDIIRGVIPFVILVMVGLALCTIFPQLVTFLPSTMIRG